MKKKRILSYMTITNLYTLAYCIIGCYLLLHEAASYFIPYNELLRQLMCVLAVLVMFRHFALIYHLKRIKSIWAKVLIALCLSLLLLIIILLFSTTVRMVRINRMFWDNPIKYSVFLRQELYTFATMPDWIIAPIGLFALALVYALSYQTRVGREYILDTVSILIDSPFIESKGIDRSAKNNEDVDGFIRRIVHDELMNILSAETHDTYSD